MSIPSELCDKFRQEFAKKFEPYGWKYLKSTHELKKQVKDIVFQVSIESSWSNSADSARVRLKSISWCKSISKKYCQDATVMVFQFSPKCCDNFEWWQLITPDEYEQAFLDASSQFEKTMLSLVEQFENNYEATVWEIAMNGYCDENIRNVFCRMEYAGHVLGRKLGQQVAIKRYGMMSEERQAGMRKEIQEYLENLERAKKWQSNGLYFVSSDVMYLVDNGIVGLDKNGLIIFPSIE